MTKKELQRSRMMIYFIDAAHRILQQEGLQGITIRKVSDLAGYNSATLYNYFDNLEHLVFFAAMRFLGEYARELSQCAKGSRDSLDRYIRVWTCFCRHSFSKPEVYNAIFFSRPNDPLSELVNQYYRLYPEDLEGQPEELLPMLLRESIYERNKAVLVDCVRDGFVREEDVLDINDMTLLLYHGILQRVCGGTWEGSADDATVTMLRYIERVLDAFGVETKRPLG